MLAEDKATVSAARSVLSPVGITLCGLGFALWAGTVAAQQPPAPAPAPAPASPPGPAPQPAQHSVPAESATRAEAVPAVPAATPVDGSGRDGNGSPLLPLMAKGAGGLTAAEVATLAVKTSARGRKATAVAETAELRAGRAYSLFVPRLSLTARYTRLSDIDLPTDFGPPGEDFNIYFPNNLLFRASIRVPVSDYFLSLNEHYSAAKQLEVVAQLQEQGEHQAVAHEAVALYFTLARTVAARRLSEDRLEKLKGFVEEIRVLVEGGELSAVQLSQAQARFAGARAIAFRDAGNQRTAEMALRVQVGVPLDKPIGVAEPLIDTRPPTPAPQDLETALRTADRERPELVALRELIKAQEHTASATAAGRYPSLSVFGDLDYANPNQRFFPLEQEFQPTWQFGVELTWSPNDLAVKQTELDESRLEVVRSASDLEILRARVVVEVTSAFEDALAAAAAVETSRVAVAAAEDSWRTTLALFHAGEATSRAVLDAEVELREAQLAWLDNVLLTHAAHVDLLHATGQLKY